MLIYCIEEHPDYLVVVDPFFDTLDRGDLTVTTSTVTLLEVLVQPLRSDETALIAEYRDILLHNLEQWRGKA
ncbi:MAG: twitching motility protein PilT [bacterium]|nr:twitching motility protein PilT [bacterium]